MNIEQLQYVCEVAKTNSITVAAENLFVTQQTISKAINKLEVELDKRLFIRSYKGVTLTDDGRYFVEKATRIVNHLEKLYQIMSDEQPVNLSGEVQLIGSNFIIQTIISKAMTSFNNQYPQIKLMIQEQLASEILDFVGTHDKGVGIIAIVNDNTGVGKIKSFQDNVDFDVIYQDRLLASVSDKHPLAQRDKISFREMVQYPLVMGDCPGFENVLNQEYGLKTRVLINSSNGILLNKAVTGGMAVGFSSELLNASDCKMDNVVNIPIDEEPQLNIMIVKSKGYQLNAMENLLLDELKFVLQSFEKK